VEILNIDFEKGGNMNSKKRLFWVIGVAFFILANGANVFAALESGISLSSPGPFKVNDTFTFQIKVTGNQNFSTLDGRVSFSKDKLSVISAAWSSNALSQLYMQSLDDPATANSNGVFSFNAFTMDFNGIDPNIYGNPLLTITVKCIAEGTGIVGNASTSAWMLSDSMLNSYTGSYPVQTISITSSDTRIINLNGDLAFGNVDAGSIKQLPFTISNSGNSTLTVSSISYPLGFIGNWSGGTINPGGSQSVTVTFSPTAAQSYGGTVTVNSDKTAGVNTVSVSGTGVSDVSKDIMGDFDKSGRIELQDAIIGLQVTAELRNAADLGYTGNIGLGDVIYILRVLAGITDTESEISFEALSDEEARILDTTEEANYGLNDIVLPNGESLGSFLAKITRDQNPKMTLIAKMLEKAVELTDRTKRHPEEGANMPEQWGLGYSYGSRDYANRDVPPYRNPPNADGSTCTEKIFGLDCSGFVFQALFNAGLDVRGSDKKVWVDRERDISVLNQKLKAKDSVYSDLTAKDMKQQDGTPIPPSQFQAGDIIYWLKDKYNKTTGKYVPTGFHIGIILKSRDGGLAVFQSGGKIGDSIYQCKKNREPFFVLTTDSFTDLKNEGVPDTILTQLNGLKDKKEYKSQSDLMNVVKTTIGDAEYAKYESKILKQIERPRGSTVKRLDDPYWFGSGKPYGIVRFVFPPCPNMIVRYSGSSSGSFSINFYEDGTYSNGKGSGTWLLSGTTLSFSHDNGSWAGGGWIGTLDPTSCKVSGGTAKYGSVMSWSWSAY